MSSNKQVKLSAKWQLDAAMLSRPVDLTSLVTMSRSNPENFAEDNTLHRLVTSLLNEQNAKKSDKDTKLDVLNILANVAVGSKAAGAVVRNALQGVSEWFDEYVAGQESEAGQEPEFSKAMTLLLARCWDYRLKTEDVLELTRGDRKIALCTVVGLLEDGETYSTELKQRQKPEEGKVGQWEHELVCHRYEKPLLLQICRLLRGFTHPGTYFESGGEGEGLALHSVENFADEMDTLLEITLRSSLVEKLSMALYDCLFQDENIDADDGAEDSKMDEYASSLSEYDHTAVASVHAFLQNLYFYATQNTDEYRRHLLMETLLIPRFILPYLDRCVIHATILNTRAEAYADMLEGDVVANMALHNPQLVKGISSSLRTLIIASFRAPHTQFVMMLLRRLNPTSQILRASAFCRFHDYIFALLCMLNVNMGALDLSSEAETAEASADDKYATQLLRQLSNIFASMDVAKQNRVCKRVMFSGALPLARDSPSYSAVMSVLDGGEAGQISYAEGAGAASGRGGAEGGFGSTLRESEEAAEFSNLRAVAKKSAQERMVSLRNSDDREAVAAAAAASDSQPKQSAFQIAVSVANASSGQTRDRKDSRSTAADSKSAAPVDDSSKYRLLGQLPGLGPAGAKSKEERDRDINIAVNLELNAERKPPSNFMKGGDSKADAKGSSTKEGGIPKKFLCAINGHVMKDPVRVEATGMVFESSTIEIWLSTRGQVCPITNTPLTRGDLVPADDLRNEIMRYHIQQTTMRTSSNNDDDLYDF